MNKNLLLTLLILLNAIVVSAQWTTAGSSWSYTLKGSADANYVKVNSSTNSTPSKASFLPAPTSGTSRVLVGAAGGGFLLNSNGLTITPANSGINKFSVFEIPEAKDVAAISFNIQFTPTPSSAVMIFAIGNQSDGTTLFKTASSVYRGSTELFTALRWSYGPSENIDFAYRESTTAATSGSAKYTKINTTTFVKGGKYKVAIMSNNSSSSKTYKIANKTYTLPADKFHVWVNDVQITAGTGPDFPRSVETGDSGSSIAVANGKALNSFLFQANKKADEDNTGTYTLSDIALNY